MIQINLEKYKADLIPQKRGHYFRTEPTRKYMLNKKTHLFNNYTNEYISYKELLKNTKNTEENEKNLIEEIKKLQRKIQNYKQRKKQKKEEIDTIFINETQEKINKLQKLRTTKQLTTVKKNKDFGSFLISFSDEKVKENIKNNSNFRSDLIKKMEDYTLIICNKFNIKPVSLALHADEGYIKDGEVFYNLHFHLLTYLKTDTLKNTLFNKEDLRQLQTDTAKYFEDFGFKRGQKNTLNIKLNEAEWRDEHKRKVVKKIRKTTTMFKETFNKEQKIIDNIMKIMEELIDMESKINNEFILIELDKLIIKSKELQFKRLSLPLIKTLLRSKKLILKMITMYNNEAKVNKLMYMIEDRIDSKNKQIITKNKDSRLEKIDDEIKEINNKPSTQSIEKTFNNTIDAHLLNPQNLQNKPK